MKKVLLTAFAAMAFFAMTACNNNKAAEAVEDTTAATMEQCEKKCCEKADSAACCQAKVEGAACEQSEGKECCKKAEGQQCEKQCEKKCEKAQ